MSKGRKQGIDQDIAFLRYLPKSLAHILPEAIRKQKKGKSGYQSWLILLDSRSPIRSRTSFTGMTTTGACRLFTSLLIVKRDILSFPVHLT